MTVLPRADSEGAGRADAAAAELAGGRAVLLVDDATSSRSTLVIAAELAVPMSVAFMVRHTSGFLCAAMAERDCDRLNLPPMVDADANDRRRGIHFAVSVDARSGTTTGISAHDRALTFNALADPSTVPGDLTRPGHVVPLRGLVGGVLERAGRTEAMIDLCRLAGLRPVAVGAELVTDTGAVPTAVERQRFCDEHGIVVVSIADVVERRRCGRTLVLTGRQSTATPRGTFLVDEYVCEPSRDRYLALRYGDLSDGADVLVAVHAECVTGDVFASQGCGCSESLDAALEAISREGRGLLLYLRAEPGMESGHQYLDADRELAMAADLLAVEAVTSVRLLTDSPAIAAALERRGVVVTAVGPAAHRRAGLRRAASRRATPSSA